MVTLDLGLGDLLDGVMDDYDYERPISVDQIDMKSLDSQRLIIPDDGELNTVLGGGLVKGSLILLGGDPGVGKSHWIESETQKILLDMREDEDDKDDEEAEEGSDDDRSNFFPVTSNYLLQSRPDNVFTG